MTLRISTGARDQLLHSGGLASIFNQGSCNIYTGSQPATADSAIAGTLLGVVTRSSLALTAETRASQTITVAGTAGSINTVTVSGLNIIPDGAVAFRTDAATTAIDLCDAINRNGYYLATVAAAVVTVRPRAGAGASHNALVLATTATTLTATSGGNILGGISGANGLYLATPVAGVIGKPATVVWSFAGLAAGTAGWFRFVGASADAGGLSTLLPRIDGSIAVSGGDMGLTNIAVTVGGPNTIDRFNFTQPAQ